MARFEGWPDKRVVIEDDGVTLKFTGGTHTVFCSRPFSELPATARVRFRLYKLNIPWFYVGAAPPDAKLTKHLAKVGLAFAADGYKRLIGKKLQGAGKEREFQPAGDTPMEFTLEYESGKVSLYLEPPAGGAQRRMLQSEEGISPDWRFAVGTDVSKAHIEILESSFSAPSAPPPPLAPRPAAAEEEEEGSSDEPEPEPKPQQGATSRFEGWADQTNVSIEEDGLRLNVRAKATVFCSRPFNELPAAPRVTLLLHKASSSWVYVGAAPPDAKLTTPLYKVRACLRRFLLRLLLLLLVSRGSLPNMAGGARLHLGRLLPLPEAEGGGRQRLARVCERLPRHVQGESARAHPRVRGRCCQALLGRARERRRRPPPPADVQWYPGRLALRRRRRERQLLL